MTGAAPNGGSEAASHLLNLFEFELEHLRQLGRFFSRDERRRQRGGRGFGRVVARGLGLHRGFFLGQIDKERSITRHGRRIACFAIHGRFDVKCDDPWAAVPVVDMVSGRPAWRFESRLAVSKCHAAKLVGERQLRPP
jgi:hypothetical protein